MNLVELEGIRKGYFGVEVLHGVNFTLKAGTVHALMGENGAGKSTLVKIIAGVHKHDGGTMKIEGQQIGFDSPSKALEKGITIIHQELSAIREMSIAENIFLGREPNKWGFIDYKSLYSRTNALLQDLGISLNPQTKMKHLRVADQQMVEIAKAVSQKAKIVIMDEPTSAITDREVERLFKIIGDLKSQGTGIIYISHKMDEILQIADEISVLRDGTNVNTWDASTVDNDTIIRSMVGRDLKMQFPKTEVEQGEVMLEVKNLTRFGEYEDISFQLHRGEILGFVGLVGAGRTELMHTLFGMTAPDAGTIELEGKPIKYRHPRQAIADGIAYVTEDRKGEGLILPMSVYNNTTLSSIQNFTKNGLLQKSPQDTVVEEQVKALKIKVANVHQPVKSLSGGNQQKVVLAKWMITNPKIIIFDEPTRGIDVGAKAEIYRIMSDYAAQGNAVILVSSEMPEAMGMSDRIIALSNHKYSGELMRDGFSQEKLVQMQFQYM